MPMVGSTLGDLLRGAVDARVTLVKASGAPFDDAARKAMYQAMGAVIVAYIQTNAVVTSTVVGTATGAVAGGPGVSVVGTGTGTIA